MRTRTGWLVVGIVLVALIVSVWAVATIVRPSEDQLDEESFTYATVEAGEVGSSISLSTTVSWSSEWVGTNQSAGVVTGVAVTAGDEVVQGSILYTVNLQPVVIAQGEVPAFRAVGNATTGKDVAQIQEMLADLGYYSGAADGIAGTTTVSAITAWQKATGASPTGTVEMGDVIFVPALPSRVMLDTGLVSRGATLGGGENVVMALSASPTFTLPVTDAQSTMMPTGTRVMIASPGGGEWEAYTADRLRDAQTQTIDVTLVGKNGAVICGDECSRIPATGQSTLSSKVITVEPVTGLIVPSAALVTTATGQSAVLDDTGAQIAVTVTASARGLSTVEGVPEGTRVRVPASVSG